MKWLVEAAQVSTLIVGVILIADHDRPLSLLGAALLGVFVALMRGDR